MTLHMTTKKKCFYKLFMQWIVPNKLHVMLCNDTNGE